MLFNFTEFLAQNIYTGNLNWIHYHFFITYFKGGQEANLLKTVEMADADGLDKSEEINGSGRVEVTLEKPL